MIQLHPSKRRQAPLPALCAVALSTLLISGCGFLGGSDGGDPAAGQAAGDAIETSTNPAVSETPGTGETVPTTESGSNPTTDTKSASPSGRTDSGTGSGSGSNTGSSSSQPPASSNPGSTPSSSTVNSVQTILDDMRLLNDVQLAGVPQSNGWAKGPGHVVMGANARGTNTPSYWQPYNQSYKSGAYWQAAIPWMVIFDGVGNQASNTRVQMRKLEFYWKSRSTGQWKQLTSSDDISGENYPKHLTGSSVTSPDIRSESDGGGVSVLPPGGNLLFHGWCCGKMAIDGSDIAAVFVTMQARLIRNSSSGTDDRSKAQYLIHIGGDYYPTQGTSVNDTAPAYYLPGIGTSRAKLVTTEWRSFNFATLDVAVQEPGGNSLSEAELRSNPPPLR